MPPEDFVDVKLSPAGEALAAGCMRIHGGNYEYCFLPGESQRLSAGEFAARLSSARHNDEPVFEVAPAGRVMPDVTITLDDGATKTVVARKNGRS